jgi:DNA-binding NtrC family response regulator
MGRFEAANAGTIFLDEIGDISPETQIKLLRVLQERCFEPVGSARTIRVDVRLITATHQNLEKLIVEGRFREDLYYRLNVISITLPPLRERPEDIFELALHFLNHSAARTGKRMTHIDDEVLAALENYSWPGNIRELENVIERAVVLAEGDHISLRDLPLAVGRGVSRPGRRRSEITTLVLEPALAGEPVAGVVREPDGGGFAERELLEAALRQCGGNKARAARQLGIPRSTFFSKLKKHGIR